MAFTFSNISCPKATNSLIRSEYESPIFSQSGRYIEPLGETWHGVELSWSESLHPLSGRNHSRADHNHQAQAPGLHERICVMTSAGAWAGMSMVILTCVFNLVIIEIRLWPLHLDLSFWQLYFQGYQPRFLRQPHCPCSIKIRLSCCQRPNQSLHSSASFSAFEIPTDDPMLASFTKTGEIQFFKRPYYCYFQIFTLDVDCVGNWGTPTLQEYAWS